MVLERWQSKVKPWGPGNRRPQTFVMIHVSTTDWCFQRGSSAGCWRRWTLPICQVLLIWSTALPPGARTVTVALDAPLYLLQHDCHCPWCLKTCIRLTYVSALIGKTITQPLPVRFLSFLFQETSTDPQITSHWHFKGKRSIKALVFVW